MLTAQPLVNGHIVAWIDPGLAEQAMWLALATPAFSGSATSKRHWQRWEPIYELADAGERERSFARLAQAEFAALGLLEPVWQALDERPDLAQRTSRLLVASADTRLDEGVTCEPHGEQLGLKVIPERFADPSGLRTWARHVLGHAADTLDPAFGYIRGWEGAAGAAQREPVRLRLHRLWDVTIDARLAAGGYLPEVETRGHHQSLIAADLPTVEGWVVDAIADLLWTRRPSFGDLRSWAERPVELVHAVAPGQAAHEARDRCPLCGFASPDIAIPGAALAAQVAAEFASWRPGLGLCARCSDRFTLTALLGGAS